MVIGLLASRWTRKHVNAARRFVERFCETPIYWAGARDERPTILSARRWRVLEDGCAEKRRFDPMRSQRRNFGKVNGRSRSADQWRISGMIVVSRGDHCHGAIVLDTIRILVDALV
jgi:hypothetical protein